MPRNRNRRSRRVGRKVRSTVSNSGLRAALTKIARTGQIGAALTPRTSIEVINASALQHGYRSIGDLKAAVAAAMQGASGKSLGAATGAVTTGLTTSLVATTDVYGCYTTASPVPGVPVFGWRVKVSASVLNFAHRTYQVDIGPGVTSAVPALTLPTPVVSLAIDAHNPVAEFVIMSPSNGAGMFTIVPGVQGQGIGASLNSSGNIVAVRAIDSNTFVTITSINARDLLNRPQISSFRDEDYGIEEEFDDLFADADVDEQGVLDYDSVVLR